MAKAEGAYRTIGELSAETGVPQHILRYWETRFPQLKPLQRAGNRRYYRPEDTALVRRIDRWLNQEGYTVRGVQKLLAGNAVPAAPGAEAAAEGSAPPAPAGRATAPDERLLAELRSIRASLQRSLDEDAAAA